jgi:uncharacterized membrane protein
MQVSGELFSTGAVASASMLYAAVLGLAVRLAPWRRLVENERSNVFFGALVGLLVLWVLRTDVTDGLVFHLSGMTALTLIFGWALAVIGGSLVLLGINLAGLADWAGFPLSAFVEVLLPVTLTQMVLVVVRSALPKHFFVYVFVNAFFTGGVVAVISAYAAALLLVVGGAHGWSEMQDTFFPFFPLMFLPEAFLNGWVMTLLVVFRPEWVRTFRDEEYLHGK